MLREARRREKGVSAAYGEGEGYVDGFAPFLRVAHISVDLLVCQYVMEPAVEERGPHGWEDGVCSPRTRQEAVGKGNSEPVGWEEVGLRRLPQRARGVWLDQTVDDDDADNCSQVRVSCTIIASAVPI